MTRSTSQTGLRSEATLEDAPKDDEPAVTLNPELASWCPACGVDPHVECRGSSEHNGSHGARHGAFHRKRGEWLNPADTKDGERERAAWCLVIGDVELGPNFSPLRVYRLRAHGTDYPLVRYYAAHELERLFKRASW